MAKLWTAQEEKVLTDYMGVRRVLYWRDKLAIHKMLPNRSGSAIEKRWAIILKRKTSPIAEPAPSLFSKISPALAGICGGVPAGVGVSPGLQYNPVDVAFTRSITKTDIIRHYRDMGLRGKITLELGE